MLSFLYRQLSSKVVPVGLTTWPTPGRMTEVSPARSIGPTGTGMAKSAGHIRNQVMLDKGKPDVVVAFPGGRGTADMVRRAEGAGIEVRRIKWPLVDNADL